MKIKQIGNGGAFNYEMPNSAFLIENQDKYLLFDCGYSIYAELRKHDKAEEIDLKKLDSIYISHMDDDHMGSLKTLLYYQYFVNGNTTKVYAHEHVYHKVLELLQNTNSKLENGEYVDAKIVDVIEVKYSGTFVHNMRLLPTQCLHHTVCYGLVLSTATGTLFISGDTKARKQLAILMRALLEDSRNTIIFHDFSNWDCEGSQVHACKSDTERLYSQEVRDAITWYHNDGPFIGDWQTV